MVFRPDRRRARSPDPFLDWKVGIFSAGAVFAMAGIYLDERWMTGAAIVVLLAGLALRFVPTGEEGESEGGGDVGSGEGAAAGGERSDEDGAEAGADDPERRGGAV